MIPGLPPQPDLHLVILRQERKIKLKDSDWTQGGDSPLDASKKAEWATYRQTLRDIPLDTSITLENNIDEEWNLINVSWPTEPE